jgi:TIR domain
MPRALAFLAAFIIAASCVACGTADNTNANTSFQPAEKTDRITVTYPNLFLQDDESERGKVTFELEETSGEVIRSTVSNENTTRTIDKPRIAIRPLVPEQYDTYVEVNLLTTGLAKTDPPNLKQPYTGGRLVWEWNLKPAEGKAADEIVSFRFQVNVTRRAKTGDVTTEEISDIWPRSFAVRVGPPAPLVDAALYSSPFFAAGGLVALGLSLRKRKMLPGVEGEGGGEGEDGVGSESAMAAGGAGLEEEVRGTVYAPGQAGPGDGFLVQVFLHLPEQADSLDELAKEADEDARRRVSTTLQKKITRGTELGFYLLMPGLEVDDPVQTCVWDGEPACVQFGVSVPEGCKAGSLFGTVTVSENSVPIGHLKFKFKVTAGLAGGAQAPSPEPVAAGEMVRYRQAFISYASNDRPEVLKRVQMLNLAKIKFFQDLLTLEPGDQWEKLLYEYIDKSDVFFLFWSSAASRSEWVKREVEYAIRNRAGGAESGPEIIPVIIEGPPPAPAPAELRSIHFNDKLLYFINPAGSEAKPLDG